jgi:hypothetical protein
MPGDGGSARTHPQRFGLTEAFEPRRRVSGADLTTLLLALMRQRAARVRRARSLGGMRWIGSQAFCSHRPALRRCEDAAFASANQFAPCVLSPLAPFALHRARDGGSEQGRDDDARQ